MSNNPINVLFFASIKQQTGESKITLSIPENLIIKDLKEILSIRYPALGSSFQTALFAVNKEFAFDDDLIPREAEVAIFPPVSGGNGEGGEIDNHTPTVCLITEEEININTLLAEITNRRTGAAVIFSGIVRGETTRDSKHETQYLKYEAYLAMAVEKMWQVTREIRHRWSGVIGIAIVQRVGTLPAGTPTVMIACTASHRDEGAFEAARYGIDRLKEIVPIWKKEITPEGDIWIDGKYQPQPDDRNQK